MEQLPSARRLRDSIVEFIERFWKAMREEDLGAIAAGMTYYFMLALFPLLILAVWILDMLPLRGDMSAFISRVFTNVTPELGRLIQGHLEEFATRRPSGGLLVWAFAALWAASRGVGGARKGLNRVFRATKKRNFAKLRMMDLVITLCGILFVGVAIALLLSGRHFAEYLCRIFNWESSFGIAYSFVHWPLIVLLLLAGVVLAYRYLPSRKLPFRVLLYGAIPTVMGWLFLGGSFRLWLRSMANFDRIYGSLTSFFLMMVFLWMLSLFLLIGGQTASVMADKEETEQPEPGSEN